MLRCPSSHYKQSVIRFGEIVLLWQILIGFGQFIRVYFVFGKNLNLSTLEHFNAFGQRCTLLQIEKLSTLYMGAG